MCNHYWLATGDATTEIKRATPPSTAAPKKDAIQERKAPSTTTTGSKTAAIPGIELHQQARIKESYYQTGSATRPAPGKAARKIYTSNRALALPATVAANSPTIGDTGRQELQLQPPTASIETMEALVFSITPALLPSASYDSTLAALASHPAPKKATNITAAKAIYGGIWASSDLTTVHWQRTSKPGWQGGLLAGYRFANRWSVETGISITRKFYFSEGAYYVSPYPVPPNNKLTELEGQCTMLEIPLNIRYDITRNQQAAWYATAGLSSYIMKREDYDLTYLYISSGNYGVHSRSYRNASRNFFSVLQLSTGYQQQLRNGLALRIEPAMRLPLTGLGSGKLRFSSVGLQVGVTKNIWRSNKP